MAYDWENIPLDELDRAAARSRALLLQARKGVAHDIAATAVRLNVLAIRISDDGISFEQEVDSMEQVADYAEQLESVMTQITSLAIELSTVCMLRKAMLED